MGEHILDLTTTVYDRNLALFAWWLFSPRLEKLKVWSSEFYTLGVQNFKVVTFFWLVCYNP